MFTRSTRFRARVFLPGRAMATWVREPCELHPPYRINPKEIHA